MRSTLGKNWPAQNDHSSCTETAPPPAAPFVRSVTSLTEKTSSGPIQFFDCLPENHPIVFGDGCSTVIRDWSEYLVKPISNPRG